MNIVKSFMKGMDFFEEFYLLFDSVDALVGSSSKRKRMLHSQIIKSEFVQPDQQFSIQFDDFIDDIVNQSFSLSFPSLNLHFSIM